MGIIIILTLAFTAFFPWYLFQLYFQPINNHKIHIDFVEKQNNCVLLRILTFYETKITYVCVQFCILTEPAKSVKTNFNNLSFILSPTASSGYLVKIKFSRISFFKLDYVLTISSKKRDVFRE